MLVDKLNYLKETKNKIKESIYKGGLVSISDEIPFREYADLIDGQIAEIEKYLPKATAEGTSSLMYEDSSDYKASDVIEGNTLQDAEPTPTSPQEIRNISNNVKIIRECMTLIKQPYRDTTRTVNGVTFVENEDGSVTVNGTATANASYYIYNNSLTLEAGDYTQMLLSSDKTTFNTKTVRIQTQSNETNEGGSLAYNYKNFTITTKSEKFYTRLYVSSGTTANNVTVYPILVKGTYTTPLKYEQYKEPVTVTIDLKGNELCAGDKLIVKNGNATLVKKMGKIVLNGSENWSFNSSSSSPFTRSISDILTPSANNIKANIICDHFQARGFDYLKNYDYAIGVTSTNKALRVRYKDITTLDDFKTWLSSHNVTVYYEKDTPNEIDLGLVEQLRTFEGYNVVSVVTNIESTSFEETYVLKIQQETPTLLNLDEDIDENIEEFEEDLNEGNIEEI